MSLALERRLLQGFVAGFAAVGIGLGALLVLTGAEVARLLLDVEFVEVDNFAELDSSLRFFGGILFGLAVLIAWTVPRTERAAPVLQIALGGFVLGGLGRLLSAAVEGWPNAVVTALIVVELSAVIGAAWQLRLRRLVEVGGRDG